MHAKLQAIIPVYGALDDESGLRQPTRRSRCEFMIVFNQQNMHEIHIPNSTIRSTTPT